MTTKTQTTATPAQADPLELPASLRRAKTPVVEVKSDAATTETPAETPVPAPKAKRARKLDTTAISAAIKASDKAKAKDKAIKATPKAKKADPKPHQPSTIAPTDQNPAKSIVPVAFKKVYAANNDTCGRPLNVTLKDYTTTKNADGRDALDLDRLQEVALANGFDAKALYGHLNRGQQRMNVGNRLAGLVKQGKTVVIGKRKFANAEKALAAPSAQAQASAAA
jgi:hypothetical protein